MDSQSIATAAYIVAALLFIFSLAGLSKHETAKAGNIAGMTGMAMGFIFDGDACRIQRGKSLAQQLNRFATHAGSTFLNGFTVTLA